MGVKYLLWKIGNTEASYIDNTIEEVREGLRFMFEMAFDDRFVDDDDPRLEDPFLYCSKSRYESINSMDYKQLKKEYYSEFYWNLLMIEDTIDKGFFVDTDGNKVWIEIFNDKELEVTEL